MERMSSHLDHCHFMLVFRILGRTASAVPFSPLRSQCLWAAGQHSGPEGANQMETPPWKVRLSPGFQWLYKWHHELSHNSECILQATPTQHYPASASWVIQPLVTQSVAKALETCWRILPPPFSLWMLGRRGRVGCSAALGWDPSRFRVVDCRSDPGTNW